MATFATLAGIGDALDSLADRLEAVVERCVVLNDGLWNWARYRAECLGHRSVSEYVFELIREDRKASSGK